MIKRATTRAPSELSSTARTALATSSSPPSGIDEPLHVDRCLTIAVGHNRQVELGQAVHHSTGDTGNVDDRPHPVVLVRFCVDVGVTLRFRKAEPDRGRVSPEVLVCAWVFVTMRAADRATVDAFEQVVTAIPHVRQARRLFGDPDYLLRVIAADLPAFQQLYDDRLATLPRVQRLSSTLVMKSVVETEPSHSEAGPGRAHTA